MVDYKGQVLSERLYQVVFFIAGIIGFGAGYAADNFEITFKFWAGGMVLAMFLSIPDWPFLNKNPVDWKGTCTVAGAALSGLQPHEDVDKNTRGNRNKKSRKD